ncbi:PD40 domain-containing protein [candidate division FCPU426 bacterium]|nr:PD40 domain-containing protein [candidate division FCPU426 bacterium]
MKAIKDKRQLCCCTGRGIAAGNSRQTGCFFQRIMKGLLVGVGFYALAQAAQAKEQLIAKIDIKTWSERSFIVSPDRRSVAYVSPNMRQKKLFVYWNLKAGKLYDAIKEDYLVISKDGRHLAYPAQQGNAWFMVVDGEEQQACADILSPPFFSPDSSRIAYIARQDGKELVVSGNRPGPGFDRITSLPHFDPDSRQMSYTGSNGDDHFIVSNSQILGPYGKAPEVTPSADGSRVAYTYTQDNKKGILLAGTLIHEYPADSEVSFLSISPDGQKAALVHDSQLVGLEGTAVKKRIPLAGKMDYGITFGLDGGSLLYSVCSGREYCLMEDDRVIICCDRIINRGVFSPDRRRIAYAVRKGGREYVLCGGKTQSAYDEIKAESLAFGPGGRVLAYIARKGEQWLVVSNGQESPPYQNVDGIVFGPKDEDLAYMALAGGDLHLMVNGTSKNMKCDNYLKGTPVFTPDGRQVVCGLEKKGKWYVATVNKKGKPFDEILIYDEPDVALPSYTTLIFDSPNRFHFLGKRGNRVYLVDTDL